MITRDEVVKLRAVGRWLETLQELQEGIELITQRPGSGRDVALGGWLLAAV